MASLDGNFVVVEQGNNSRGSAGKHVSLAIRKLANIDRVKPSKSHAIVPVNVFDWVDAVEKRSAIDQRIR